jgi:pimeloyl-ACP methyl ester carboxylesterase
MPMSERLVKSLNDDGTHTTARIRDGKGPALVLIPGTWGNMRTRGRLMELLDPDLTIVNVALAGQDDNWPPPSEPSIPRFAPEVFRLADKIGLERFFVGGHSLGGMVAIEMLRAKDNRIRGAISIEGWTHHDVASNAFAGNINGTLKPEQQAFVEDERNKLFDRWGPAMRTKYTSVWKQWDGSDILATTTVPILEIWGDRARPLPSRAAMRIPERPNIELFWVRGASHSLLVEAPEILAKEMNRFIRSAAS